MPTDDQYAATLRWAIDRQKADYTDIRKQLRRYFVVVVTVIAVRGVAFFSGDGAFLGGPRSTSLAQDGVLWQTNTLPAKVAPAFTDSFEMLGALFSALGLALIFISLDGVVSVERSQKCHPIGELGNIVGKDIGQLEDWVKNNDELVRVADQRRKDIIRLGRHGIVLIIATYILHLFSTGLALGAFIILLYLYQKFYFMFKNDSILNNSFMKKFLIIIVIVFTILQPVIAYQDVYGPLPVKYRLIPIVISLVVVFYYLRSDVKSISNIAKNYLREF